MNLRWFGFTIRHVKEITHVVIVEEDYETALEELVKEHPFKWGETAWVIHCWESETELKDK